MKYYVTLTGLNYRFGTQPFTVGQKVKKKLVKEPENDFDREATSAPELPGLGKVGYVANSTHTVLGDCYSAGRIYDKIALLPPQGEVCACQCGGMQRKGGGYRAGWPAAGRSATGLLWQRAFCQNAMASSSLPKSRPVARSTGGNSLPHIRRLYAAYHRIGKHMLHLCGGSSADLIIDAACAAAQSPSTV